jgi:hypothetical protein
VPSLRPPGLAALALACAACGTSAVAASAPDPAAGAPATVEVDVFSGRPNPTWTLSTTERADLRERLADLPAADPAAFSSNLGYRGFLVTAADLGTVTVQRGTVRVGDDRHYRDPNRELERWLLSTGEDELEPGVAEVVAGELG